MEIAPPTLDEVAKLFGGKSLGTVPETWEFPDPASAKDFYRKVKPEVWQLAELAGVR